MKISFHKYHGAGNDFIIIDNRKLRWNPVVEQIALMCDRHFGIGADGLMLLSDQKGYDFRMTYYNSDGKESTLCGNGGRCMTAFASDRGIVDRKARFSATDGEHEAMILNRSGNTRQVILRMKDVTVEDPADGDFFIDTGSPHYVIFGSRIDRLDILKKARKIRYGASFSPDGTNVDFAEKKEDHLFVRTYERGVEDETLSCGTGITAAALAFATIQKDNPGFFRIRTKGGELKVSFRQAGKQFTDIWLEGPVVFVFEGKWRL